MLGITGYLMHLVTSEVKRLAGTLAWKNVVLVLGTIT